MSNLEKFSKGLTLARRATSYKGSYEEYVTLQYKGYVEICKRCEVKPLTKQKWLDGQN